MGDQYKQALLSCWDSFLVFELYTPCRYGSAKPKYQARRIILDSFFASFCFSSCSNMNAALRLLALAAGWPRRHFFPFCLCLLVQNARYDTRGNKYFFFCFDLDRYVRARVRYGGARLPDPCVSRHAQYCAPLQFRHVHKSDVCKHSTHSASSLFGMHTSHYGTHVLMNMAELVVSSAEAILNLVFICARLITCMLTIKYMQ